MMAVKRAQRVTQLIEWEFMKLHKEGKNIPRIAEETHISCRTIYSNLGEIAKKNGVSRESLLEIPHKQHQMSKYHFPKKVQNESPKEINAYVSDLFSVSEKLIADIEEVLHND